jgi:hypothetical protein
LPTLHRNFSSFSLSSPSLPGSPTILVFMVHSSFSDHSCLTTHLGSFDSHFTDTLVNVSPLPKYRKWSIYNT